MAQSISLALRYKQQLHAQQLLKTTQKTHFHCYITSQCPQNQIFLIFLFKRHSTLHVIFPDMAARIKQWCTVVTQPCLFYHETLNDTSSDSIAHIVWRSHVTSIDFTSHRFHGTSRTRPMNKSWGSDARHWTKRVSKFKHVPWPYYTLVIKARQDNDGLPPSCLWLDSLRLKETKIVVFFRLEIEQLTINV